MTTFRPIIASPVPASVTLPFTVMFCEKAVSDNAVMTRISKALRPLILRPEDLLNATFDFVIEKLIRVSNFMLFSTFSAGPAGPWL